MTFTPISELRGSMVPRLPKLNRQIEDELRKFRFAVVADFADERARLAALGCKVETAEHAWVHWRSLYLNHPEGDQVELVCYHESV